MLHWFYKWLGNKIENTKYAEEAPQLIGSNAIKKARGLAKLDRDADISADPISFKMFKANGGWAVEFKQYDENSDRIHSSLYVVTNEEELGKHISQIITMEALKR